MTERRLVVVRHGVTDWNREGRFQGHLDPPLADDGQLEARLAARRIAGDPALRPARIVASSLARAAQTAEAIGAAVGVAVDPDPRLMEIGQGEWEGRTHADLAVSDAARYRAWREATGIRQPPGGETVASAAWRLRALLDDLSDGPWPTLVVSHGGTIRVLAGLLFGLADGRSWGLDVDNASIGVATGMAGSYWRLERWNDTLHLLGIEPTHHDEAEGKPLAL